MVEGSDGHFLTTLNGELANVLKEKLANCGQLQYYTMNILKNTTLTDYPTKRSIERKLG